MKTYRMNVKQIDEHTFAQAEVPQSVVDEIRADVIEELLKEAKEQYTTSEITYYDGTTDTVRYVALALLEQIAGQLKNPNLQ